MGKICKDYIISFSKRNGRHLGLLIFILILWIICGVLSPHFFKFNNIMLLLRQCSTILIGGCGMTFVLLTGGTDLSVGAMAALSGMVVGIGITNWNISGALAILLGLCVGAFFGTINGLLISKYKLQPMVCTLGTQSIINGLTLLSTSGRSLFVVNKLFVKIGNGSIVGFPIPFVIAIVLFLISFLVLNKSIFGRSVYSIGGNEEATRLSGIHIIKNKTLVYTISGVAASCVGIILVCTLGASEPTVCKDLALDSIAVSAIGGISLFGGLGSIVGTMLGALLIGTIKNGLTMLNIVSYYQQVIIGTVIIFAVLMEQFKKKTN